jgi:hypothetical protein
MSNGSDEGDHCAGRAVAAVAAGLGGLAVLRFVLPASTPRIRASGKAGPGGVAVLLGADQHVIEALAAQRPHVPLREEFGLRPARVQMRSSGGWRTLQGLAGFALLHSCQSAATKWALTNSTPPAAVHRQRLVPARTRTRLTTPASKSTTKR